MNQWGALADIQDEGFCAICAPRAHQRWQPDRGRAARAAGLIDAELGGGVIKQRVSRPGQGRSGGYRVLMAYRPKARAVFVYGFAKSDRENLGEDELATLRDIARAWLEADGSRLARALADGLIQEVTDEDHKNET